MKLLAKELWFLVFIMLLALFFRWLLYPDQPLLPF